MSLLLFRLGAALGLMTMCAVPVSALETSPQTGGQSSSPEAEAVIEYCRSIADTARELRAARQEAMLKDLESQIETKLQELETRRTELQSWIERQEALKAAAEKALVDIYATMEADVAAEQLAGFDARIASSVLRQMKPRQASAILNEMRPEQATPLMRIIGSASERPEP